jgi:hypothetical protein
MMDGHQDFDDTTAEALLAGAGADADPRLAETIRDVRAAFGSTLPPVGAELAAFVGLPEPVADLAPRRFERKRASLLAKAGAAAAAVVAVTGGLAVAGALPAPVQDAVSHIGVGPARDAHSDKETDKDADADKTAVAAKSTASTAVHASSTTVPTSTTPTTHADKNADNHGAVVSEVAHNHDLTGCEHGRAVSAVASNGKAQDKPCPTTTTTVPGENGKHDDGESNGHEGTPPTSVGGHRGLGQGNAHVGRGSLGGEKGHGSSGGGPRR